MKKRPILNAYEMKLFKEWIADGNALENEKGVWLEQTTQYRVKFTYEELQNYFKKEYLTYKNGGSAKDLLSSRAGKVAKKEKSLNLKAYNVPSVPYAINPLNEGLDEIFQDIVGKDEVRERMNGVNFVENTATGTDAHKLLHLVGKREGKFKDGNYYLFSTMENEWSKDKILSKKMSVAEYYKQRSLIEERFPNWIPIVYDSFDYKQEFNLPTLYDVVNSLVVSKLLNKETNAIIIEFNTKDGAYQISFNAKIFRSLIKSLIMAGITDATGYFNAPSRGVTILDSSLKFPNKNKRDEFFMENSFGLVMPLMFPDEETLEETRKTGLEMAEIDNLVYEFPVIRVINPNEYEIEIYGQDTLTYSRGKGIKIGTKSTTKSTPKETPKATPKTTDKKTALGNKLRKGMVVRIEYKESNGSTLSYDLFYDNGDFIEYVLIINKKGEELVEAEEIITEKELNEKYTELSEFIIDEFYETKEDGGELMASGGQMELFVGGGRAVRPSMFEIYQVKDKMGRVAYFTDKDLQKFLNDWNEDYDTDYEDWIEFNEYEREFIIKPIFSKNEMGGDVSYSNEPIAVFRFQDLEDKTESLMSDVDIIEFLEEWNRDMQTNYSDWRDFNKGEEYYRITPVFSSNEMGGGVNYYEGGGWVQKPIKIKKDVYKFQDHQGVGYIVKRGVGERTNPMWIVSTDEEGTWDGSHNPFYTKKEAIEYIESFFNKGGNVDFEETQINDIANWENEEIANYLDLSTEEVANNREKYVRLAQNELMLSGVDSYDNGGGVDKVKKDRYGNDVKIGDAIHIRVLTGRYGQTKDYEGIVTNFDQFGNVELDGQRSVRYTANYKFDDYEHGHHIWVEKINATDIKENLRVPKKFVPTFSSRDKVYGEDINFTGTREEFKEFIKNKYPNSVWGQWNPLYNQGWRYNNGKYLSPDKQEYDSFDFYESVEQGQGNSYMLMISKTYADGGVTDSDLRKLLPKEKMVKLLKENKFKSFDSSEIEIGKFEYDTNTYNPFITNFRLTINCFPCIIVIDQVSDNAYEVKIAKDDGWIGGIYKDSWEYIFEIPKINYEEFEKGLKKVINDKIITLYNYVDFVKTFYFVGTIEEAEKFAKKNGLKAEYYSNEYYDDVKKRFYRIIDKERGIRYFSNKTTFLIIGTATKRQIEQNRSDNWGRSVKGGSVNSYAMGGTMDVVIASSPTLEGIKKLISEYLYGSTITLVQIDDDGEFFEVHNKKGITPFYVKLKNNKYQFVPSQDNYSRGGTLDKKYNFNDFGIKSYRELIDRNEFVSKFKSINNSADFDRIKYNRMRGEEQLKYVQRLNKQVNKYNLTLRDGSFYEVSKEIFDYADIPETETKNYYTKFDEPSGYIWKRGGSLKKKSNDLGEYYEKYSNGGFVGGDIIKFKYDGKDFTRKVESVDEMGNALVNLMKSEKATINPADIFDIKKEFTEKDVIIKKIGFNEALAEYLISVSPTFAVWLADSILENEIEERQESKEVVLKAINEKSISKNTNYLNNNFGGTIREILDWLQHPSTPKQNLRELTFKEALEKARAWHQELTTSGGDLNFTEPKENIILKKYPPNEFGKTYYWVFIPKSYCDIESARMGHCGRTGAGSLISLRSVFKNTNEDTISDSHVTIAYNYEEGKFYQAKGKQNKKPVEKYFPYIFDLIQLLANGEIQKQYELNNEEKLKEIKEYDKKIKEIDEKVSKHIRNGLGFTQNGDVYFRSENNLLGYEIEDKQYADKFLGKNFKKNILEDITRYLDDNAYINDFGNKYAKLQELQNNVRNNREFEGYELAKEELVEDYFNWYLENISYPYKEWKELQNDRYYAQLGMDDYNFDFNGFESEYQASNDYGWEDMTNKQIKELYELKPELFNDFAGQYMLYKIGLIDEKPNTIVTIEKSVEYVADLLSVDRDLSDDFVEKVLTGETYDFLSSDIYVYYYDNAGDYVDDLKKEDYDAVLDKIVEITGLDKEIVEENGAKHYLDGDDEEFDSETFEDIKRAIASALEGAEISSYQNYYYDAIKEALGELGVIKKLDDTGVEIEVDLKDLIGISAISGYMKDLDRENLEDVFFEAESNGDFSLPDLSIDDRYSGDTYNWQDGFDINNYAVGGSVKYKAPSYKKKIFGVYIFETKNKSFELEVYRFERQNDTEDALEIQNDLREELGSIIIKNVAWKNLLSGKKVMASSSKNNYVGTLRQVNTFAVGGAVYPDLSMQKPQVVNDSIQLAEFELKQAKELTTINNIKNQKILSSDDAVDIFRQIWEKDTISAYEQAYVLFVNTNNKPKGFYHHSSGGIDGTIMDIQMISGMAVKSLSKGVIIAHNHPSGNTQPSDADRRITEQMKEALKLFNIKLLDSLILTENSYLSFANMGIL